ncbi:hypothetical protein KI688_010507 [Linnemannia hyalina]|uniref:WD40 repeat-like protein n=1 Tax=Linnemannia hyalina TaxID=64524 RepID=A0A9P7XZP4_9FUNG|nr:hypothetical protein KI688_010507 [Linnemannia hyalina]
MTDHPLDQLNLHVPGSESANSTVCIKMRVKFRRLRRFFKSKSKSKEVKPIPSNQSQHSRLSFQQPTRPYSIISKANSFPSGNSQSTYTTDNQLTSPTSDNQSTPSTTVQENVLSAPFYISRTLEDIFDEDVPRPTMKTELPQLQQRIEMTQQLVYCNALLLRDTLSPQKSATGEAAENGATFILQEPALDKTELDWLKMTKKDPMEADSLRWLATCVVEQFVADANKDSSKISEIVALGPVLQKEPYRNLLSTFIKEFDDGRILDVDMLQGLVQLVQSASPGYLEPDDLVNILKIVRVRLQGTHQQSTEHSYHLTLAVSRVLDVMAEHKVQDLDRVLEHEPLSDVLSGLKGSSDLYQLYQACYAFQALQYVPNDETALGAVFRHTIGVADGLTKVSAVMKLDLTSALEGLVKLQEVLGETAEVAGSVYEGFCLLMKGGRGVFDSLKEAFGSGRRHPWYPAVKVAYAFAQAGQLKDLKVLIVESPCRQDPLFQWGICQLLGEIAADPAWAVSARQQSVSLLGHLCQHDQNWGRDKSIKAWMFTIITKLHAASDQVVSEAAHSVLQDLTVKKSALIKHPYPLRARLPLPSASPLLTKVQNIQYLEHDLHKYRLHRLKEAKLSVYISPMAMANLQAHDDELFPLKEKFQEFLTSERQVMLILGDSGAGKSTFNKHLESELLRTYTRGGPIPLFINLPAIDRPDKDLIGEHLRTNNFSEAQIQEMKQYRQFVLICDGYDESQLTVNLHTANLFNRSGQWNVKTVISCRTQFLGQNYRSRFIPDGTGHYTRQATDLFQEAVIAPFSKEQIEDYVKQYVPLEPRTWTTKDYMDKLTIIPNLMDLVKNPFLLSLSLEALPGVTEGKQDLSAIKISRVQLYDTFVRHWLDVNSRRLQRNVLTREDRDMLDQLLEAGFIPMGIDYSTRLASAIFEHQDGNPVVQYIHIKDEKSWRAKFFGPDSKTRLMRVSSPLNRKGSQFRFLHRSMLEYFLSLAVFDPSSHNDHEFAMHSGTGSTDAALSNAESLLFKRSLLTEPMVIQFLCERVKQHSDFKKQLLAIIEQSKTDVNAATAAANSITILVRARVLFNSANLRCIRIAGADLSDGQFDSAQLQGADLRGVNFARTWLRQADFGNAQMDGVRFGELPYLEVEASVNTIAFSPDGKIFAAALRHGRLITYDTTAWTRVHQHKGQSLVLSIAFSPNNQYLAFGSEDKTCRLWDTASGETSLVMEGHKGGVNSVAFSPCGKQIASSSSDSTIRLWNSETGECLFVLSGHRAPILSAAYSSDGLKLVSGSNDRTIRVWDPKTGTPEADWVIPRIDGPRVALSADGRRFAVVTGSKRPKIQLMDTNTGEKGLVLDDDAERLTDIAFSPIGELIVSSSGSSGDKTVRLWDSSNGQLISRLLGHSDQITACTFSPDGLQIASGDLDGIIRLWEVNINLSSSFTQKRAAKVRTVAYSHDGLFITSYHDDNTIQRWDSSTGASGPILSSFTYGVISVSISPNDNWFTSSYGSRNVRLSNAQTHAVERVLLGSSSYQVGNMRFSPYSRWFVESVQLLDLESTDEQGKEVDETADEQGKDVDDTADEQGKDVDDTADEQGKDVDDTADEQGKEEDETADECRLTGSVVFSPNGDQIAVEFLSSPSRLRLFGSGVTGLRQPLKEVCLSDRLRSMDYSPDGQRLVLGTGAYSALLWDLQSDEPDVKLEGHTGAVYSVAYSPCGKWILSGSEDKTARLWSGEDDSWSCVAVANGCSEAVKSVAWNPVMPMEFVTGSDDGSVRVWRISSVEAGDVSICMHWGSHIGRLCAADLTFKGAVGLSSFSHKLLIQRGAVDDSLSSEGANGSNEEEIEVAVA